MFNLWPALSVSCRNLSLNPTLGVLFFTLHKTVMARFISHAAANHRTNPSKNFFLQSRTLLRVGNTDYKGSIQMIDYSIRAAELCSLNVRMKPTKTSSAKNAAVRATHSLITLTLSQCCEFLYFYCVVTL